jgi:hypothetical protein
MEQVRYADIGIGRNRALARSGLTNVLAMEAGRSVSWWASHRVGGIGWQNVRRKGEPRTRDAISG